MADTCILGIDIRESDYRQELGQIALLPIDQSMQIPYYAILFRVLPVCLQIEGTKKLLFNVKKEA